MYICGMCVFLSRPKELCDDVWQDLLYRCDSGRAGLGPEGVPLAVVGTRAK